MFILFCHYYHSETDPVTIIEVKILYSIALFMVSFSHLHYNAIQRGCEACNFGLKQQNGPKLSHIHTILYCNVNRKLNI